MPADIVGTNIVQEHSHGGTFFEFQPGRSLRTSSCADGSTRHAKAQSALLEAMQDVSVSVGKTTTTSSSHSSSWRSNPLEMEGTYPLPEAQLDRFLQAQGVVSIRPCTASSNGRPATPT